MTKLQFEKYSILAATLGEDSALPDIHVNSYIRANITVSHRVCVDSLSQEEVLSAYPLPREIDFRIH